MGNCCIRDKAEVLPSSTLPADSDAVESSFISPLQLDTPQVEKKTAAKRSKTAEIHTRKVIATSTPRKAVRRRSLTLTSAAVPIRRLTQGFEEVYEVKSKALELNIGSYVLAIHITTQTQRLVMKIPRKKAAVDLQVTEDLGTLGQLEHPNILKPDAILFNDRSIYVISESFDGFRFVNYSTIAETAAKEAVRSLAIQALRGMAYAHSKGHLFLSLSITNIIFFKGADDQIMLKLVAFGGREKLNRDQYTSLRNPSMYAAPEAWHSEGTEKADVWSCGVVLYILMANSAPFEGSNPKKLESAVLAGPHFSPKMWGKFDPNAKALISWMLEVDPANRPTAAECLAHPWLQRSLSPSLTAMSLALTQLRKFHGGNRLKLEILSFIVMHTLNSEEKKPHQEVFAQINTSKSGLISLQELTSAFAQVIRPEFAETVAAAAMEHADLNRDGTIDFSEFLLATADYRRLLHPKTLKIAFALFDPDSSGSITLEELKSVLKYQEKEVTWRAFLREIDKNGSESIEIDEFRQLVEKIVLNIRSN